MVSLATLTTHALSKVPQIKAKHDPGHILFAFVVQRNRIVSASHNLCGHRHSRPQTTSPSARFGYSRDSVHAEVAATRKALGAMDARRPWHIVVLRLGACGGLRLAKPCPCCQGFLRANGCAFVCYSTNTNTIERMPL